MNKKILIIFGIMFIGMLIGFAYINSNPTSKKEEAKEQETVKEPVPIGTINNLEIYKTDYVYDNNINGYHYTQVNVNNINEIKGYLKDVDLNDTINAVVYGKYKIIADDKTIFFDLGDDNALYLEKDVTFKLPNTIKRQIVYSSDVCSCCDAGVSECKINLCPCNTAASLPDSSNNQTSNQLNSNQAIPNVSSNSNENYQ